MELLSKTSSFTLNQGGEEVEGFSARSMSLASQCFIQRELSRLRSVLALYSVVQSGGTECSRYTLSSSLTELNVKCKLFSNLAVLNV